MSIPDDPLVIAAMLRARLDEIDAVAISRALRIYGAAHARLLEQVMALIDSLGDPTQPVPSNALALASRAELLTQIETVLTRAGVQIEPTLIEARQQAVAVAMEAAEAMAGAQAADMRQKAELARDWAKLNERAVKELVESTADGEPLGRWLRELGPETRAAVEEKIERAVVESVNVGDLAEKLTREVDMSQRRALMVTRESSFGVQRRASEQQYRENRRLLRGKMRIEKIDEKTCRACLAHHGTIYPVDALVPRHLNCRAVLGPVVRGGIGLQEPSVNAVEYLESLSEDQQRMVLGSQEGVEAWRSGEVELDDFSEVYQTEWGPQERIVGVERARANAARRRAGDRRAAD